MSNPSITGHPASKNEDAGQNFTVEQQNEIQLIKKAHGFKGDFDLAEAILHLCTTEAKLIETRIHTHPRLSDEKKQIKDIAKLSKKLDAVMSNTSAQTLIRLNEVINSLGKLTHHCSASYFKELSRMIYIISSYLRDSLPKDPGGKNPGSITREVIFALDRLYREGTGTSTACGWDDVNNTHVGDFYLFILRIHPILKKFHIFLGKKGTIGKYACESVQFYKNFSI